MKMPEFKPYIGPDIRLLGDLLIGANHPVRSLANGVVSSAGGIPTSVHTIEEILREVGYDTLHPLTDRNLAGFLNGNPNTVLDKSSLPKKDVVQATEMTPIAAALGGVLLERFGTSPQVQGVQKLVGFAQTEYDGNTIFPAPATRLIVLRSLIKGKGVRLTSDLAKDVAAFGIPRPSMSSQLTALERDGYTKHYSQGSTKPRFIFLEEERTEVVEEYLDAIDQFCEDPVLQANGLERMGQYLDKHDAVSDDTKLLVMNAIANSGKKPKDSVLDHVKSQLIELQNAGENDIPVKVLAELLGAKEGTVNNWLRRLQQEERPVISKVPRRPGGRRSLVRIHFPTAF